MSIKYEHICEECGVKFSTPKKIQRFHARECYGKYLSRTSRGENNPVWKKYIETKTCKNCSKEFQVKKYFKGKIYCGMRCFNADRKNIYTEEVKNKMSEIKKEQYKNGLQPSQSCFKKGLVPANYKGGIANASQGYVNQQVGYRKYKLQHRVVMEERLGRKLTSREIVHHCDMDRQNNDPDNLQYFRHMVAHMRLHQFAKRHGIPMTQLQFSQPWFY